jgi:hypothetical protein
VPAQSADLHIVEPPWSVVERKVRSRLPSPSSLKQLEDVLHEQRYSIALETVQDLRESAPKWLQAVLEAYSGQTPF